MWSWDITKLKGPVKWTYYYLYVIMDIFSRYVVGWSAQRELGALAKRLPRYLRKTRHQTRSIIHSEMTSKQRVVAPHAGAWIETATSRKIAFERLYF